jgi:hypothetical protein
MKIFFACSPVPLGEEDGKENANEHLTPFDPSKT